MINKNNFFRIFKNPQKEFERSYKDIRDNYGISRLRKDKFITKLPETSSKRQDYFKLDDTLIYNMDVGDRIALYKKVYSESGWVQRGADAIVADCMNTYPLVEILFEEEKYNTDKSYNAKVADIKRLMENPCHELPRRTFFALTYYEMLLYGNSYWQKLWNMAGNKILSLVRLRPETIRKVPKIDKRTGITTYYYLQIVGKEGNQTLYKYLTQDDVLHFMIPNILNPLYGRSKLDGLLYTIYMDIEAVKYQSKFFKYGITPGVIINVEDLSEENVDYFNDLISQRYANDKEPYSAMLIPGRNVKILNNKDNMADLDLRDLRHASAHEILHILGIPPLLLSLDKLQIQRQDTSYDNYIEHTIAPLHNVFCDTINEQLIRRHYDDQSIILTTGSQMIPGSKDSADFLKAMMQLVPMTVNEVRERAGLTLLDEGGDEFFFYTPNGTVPLSYQYNIIEPNDEEKTFDVDDRGKPVDPKKMFSHITFKLGHKLRRSIEYKYKKLGSTFTNIDSNKNKEGNEITRTINEEVKNPIERTMKELESEINKLSPVNKKVIL